MSERIGTTCVQGGWRPGDGQPRQVPIYQNTTWKYDTSEHMGRLFDLEESGYFYTRLANPTNDAVAAKIAELEGGCAAMLTSSGQAANFFAVFNIAAIADPECILLGGGICREQQLLPMVNAALDRIPQWGDFRTSVKRCRHTNNAGLIGAYYAFETEVGGLTDVPIR